MTVQRFRTRPVEIDAFRYTGDNFDELLQWTEGNFRLMAEGDSSTDTINIVGAQVFDRLHSTWIWVSKGQWIVRGAKGEFYPCDDETFHWKYEEVV